MLDDCKTNNHIIKQGTNTPHTMGANDNKIFSLDSTPAGDKLGV